MPRSPWAPDEPASGGGGGWAQAHPQPPFPYASPILTPDPAFARPRFCAQPPAGRARARTKRAQPRECRRPGPLQAPSTAACIPITFESTHGLAWRPHTQVTAARSCAPDNSNPAQAVDLCRICDFAHMCVSESIGRPFLPPREFTSCFECQGCCECQGPPPPHATLVLVCFMAPPRAAECQTREQARPERARAPPRFEQVAAACGSPLLLSRAHPLYIYSFPLRATPLPTACSTFRTPE